VKAIILAAGRGRRMGQVTQEKPKCMTVFNGKPLIEWQLEALQASGVEDIAIVRGYRGQQLAEYTSIFFENRRWAKTNMVCSLMCATEWLERFTCIVTYSDIFYNATAVQVLRKCSAELSITYDPDWLALWLRRFDEPLDDAESFVLDDLGYLKAIGQPAKSVEDIQGQYMGLIKFTPTGWSKVTKFLDGLSRQEIDRLDMTALLSSLIYNGVTISAVPVVGPWGEVDSETDLRTYEDMIADGDLVFP